MAELEHTIVIVGAGPTGLALGAELKRLGISSLILDRLAAGANTSRAAGIQARTLEVLEPLGVTSELLRQGLIVRTFRIRDRNKILASINFKGLKTQYPFVLVCPQDQTEAILLRRLQALGGTVQRPCEVVAIRPGENTVQVQFQSNGELKTVQTKWLVGCDGMHSVVREQAAIPFIGSNYEESFLLADVEMDWPLGREEASLFLSEQGIVVVVPLPDNNLFRIVATVKQAPAIPTITDFQQILAERGPENVAVTIHKLVWASRFHIQHRVAKVLRQGRILLAGDAAHVHSPAGGQGMNTGIQDAITLAAALKETLQGNKAALDNWQKKRLKIAYSVVKLTDQMTKLATASSPGMKLLRNIIINIVGRIPFAQRALAEKLSELDNR